MSDKPVVVYTPEPQIRDLGTVLRNMLRGARDSRYLAVRLFRRDVRSEFKDAALGYLWNFADPIVLALVFIFLRRGGYITADGLDMPYPVFVVYGMLLLQAFLRALSNPLTLLNRHHALISSTKVAPEALLTSQLLRLGFDGLFFIPIMLGVGIAFGAFNVTGILLFLLLYPAIILMGFAISVVVIPVSAIYSDLRKLVETMNRPLLFLCPTFYYAGSETVLGTINAYNPIAIMMNNLRLLAVEGQWHSPMSMAVVVISSVIVLGLGWLFFHVTVPIVAGRL
jgi:lipopolysaccharide transport system permease protein